MPDLARICHVCASGLFRAMLAILIAGTCAGSGAAQDAYRLNAGDRIAVRFVQWDTIELGFVEFDAVNGTYAVGSDGTLMLPLIGAVDVEDRSLAEVAESVSLTLQGRLGLVEPPSASLSIVGHRPIYVLGSVANPGAYDFSPGLTVRQALALAGGPATVLDDRPGREAAAVRASGVLQEIAIDIARHKVRAARLRAEMDGANEFTIPEGVTHPDGPETLKALIEHERALFQSRREARARALEALDDSRTLLETEVSTLQEKLSGLSRQVELLRESVGNMEQLYERGLVRSPSLVAQQGQLINLENRQLDTETAVFRARQSIAELERERIGIEADRRLEILRELQRSEAAVEQLAARQDMNRRLLLGTEALLVASGQEMDIQTSYRITRPGSEGPETLDATPDTRLGPADVVEVDVIILPGG
ncbi:polysaccharide biosynthesis/export family protein [Roseovarius sp. D22-M7]|uniref:polysaccharide biosynthesis/export family protein n=1 Tax=Roseovarius sp. D22-M7 TaxID=3127116 RepID=UPI00300FF165